MEKTFGDKLASSYFSHAEQKFPGIKASPSKLKTENLVTERVINVKRSALESIQEFIRIIYSASKTEEYQERIKQKDSEIQKAGTPNDSVLMAYDFHLNSQGAPKLIEVNTNASGYLISTLLYEVTETENEFGDPLRLLERSFMREWESLGETGEPHVGIIDETLLQQKMLPEFYMYQDLFESWGWKTRIDDYQNFTFDGKNLLHKDGQKISFVYNRLNDFYLARPESAALRAAYLAKAVIMSPQPRDYQRLADKQRLVDWSHPDFWQRLASPDEQEVINQVLLKSFVPSDFESIDKLWSQRKRFFFKPLRMYGGKSAFKGANVSKPTFEKIFADNKSMIQEFCAAPKFLDSKKVEWKYDLRFYVYRDQVHLAVGRAYQGQVTNFSTLGGGFCRVRFID